MVNPRLQKSMTCNEGGERKSTRIECRATTDIALRYICYVFRNGRFRANVDKTDDYRCGGSVGFAAILVIVVAPTSRLTCADMKAISRPQAPFTGAGTLGIAEGLVKCDGVLLHG
jgi:hypothetical protein